MYSSSAGFDTTTSCGKNVLSLSCGHCTQRAEKQTKGAELKNTRLWLSHITFKASVCEYVCVTLPLNKNKKSPPNHW